MLVVVVILVLIVYIKVVVVKKFVVGFWKVFSNPLLWGAGCWPFMFLMVMEGG